MTDENADDGSIPWGWITALAIVVSGMGGLVGAILLTPGDPFACNIPNPGAWMLCGWFRVFVANLVMITGLFVGGSLVLAFCIGVPRAILRSIRN